MQARHWFVYTLSDPRNHEAVRYVGVTHGKPSQRLARHTNSAKHLSQKSAHSARWIHALAQAGCKPTMVILEEGEGEGWEREAHWIAWHLERGFDLTNHSSGGPGPLGCVRSLEMRARLAAANRGKKQDPELVERRISKIRGKTHTQEARKRMSEGRKGKKLSPAAIVAAARVQADPRWREKISAANQGQKRTPETKSRISKAKTGERQTPTSKEKIREGMKRVWAERKSAGWVGWGPKDTP